MSVESLGIILARGGSKGVPNKNLRCVDGESLISITATTAARSFLSRVIVSTDSQDIADMAAGRGVGVPFLRPAELATDTSPAIDAVLHALDFLKEHEDYVPDYVMQLNNTSPFRTTEHISTALDMIKKGDCDSVVSVQETPRHPMWTQTINKKGYLKPFMKVKIDSIPNRQALPEVYSLNACIYLATTESLLKHKSFYGGKTKAYIMDQKSSWDIDTEWDLEIANLIEQEATKWQVK